MLLYIKEQSDATLSLMKRYGYAEATSGIKPLHLENRLSFPSFM
jgi:hypothetical protein